MLTKILYPKTIEELLNKLEYSINQEQNIEKLESLIKIKNWFSNLNYNLTYKCSDSEYLKLYSSDNNYALQVWNHSDVVDSIKFNLVSNFPSIYNIDITEIIFQEEN